MLATGYPMLDVFVNTIFFALLIFWIILVFHIIQDIFRSHDLGGSSKALWVLLIFVTPLIGCLIYLLVRGGSMHERQLHVLQVHQKSFEDYVRRIANSKA